MRTTSISDIELSLGFDDVAIKQKKNICKSRLDVDISSEIIKGIRRPIPMIAANMSSVTNADFCIKLWQLGAFGIMHRAAPDDVLVSEVQKIARECEWTAASIGVGNSDFELARKLIMSGANVLVIDIAHGYSDPVIDMAKRLKVHYEGVKVVVGNTVNKAMLWEVAPFVDAIKVGIGQGCFTAGTRILMSSGQYKNIEDINKGDEIINKDGKRAKVKRAFCTGMKEVVKLRNGIWYEDTYVTPDHRYWVGDLNSVSKNTLQTIGYAKLLDCKAKTSPKTDKYKWKEVQNFNQDVLLMPKIIDFNMKDSFNFIINKKNGGNFKSGITYGLDYCITPSYDFGYILGTFLGDGNSKVNFDIKHNSNKGSINWTFGKNEMYIAKKLEKNILNVFKKKVKIKTNKNTINVFLYYKPLADILNKWGKRTKKHLPDELFVNNKEYLKGIFDGLVDSDGHVSSDGRIRLANTSKKIIELFNVVCYLLFGFFPNNEKALPTIGGLKNCKLENCNTSFKSEPIRTGHKRLTKNYQISKILQNDTTSLVVQVYDLEIEDDTHSFIANNAIVHNSACETKNSAGCTEKQFSAVLKFKRLAKELGIPVISDGAIREGADLVKAIGAGANSIMAGSVFAMCPESASPLTMVHGIERKMYWGMASRMSQDQWKNGLKPGTCPEGTVKYLEVGESVDKFLERWSGALRSGITYSGGNDINSFQEVVEFVRFV